MKQNDLGIGFLVGFVFAVIIMSLLMALVVNHYRMKERIAYVERQEEIEAMRENYRNRDAVEFFDDIPGVRGAADGARADFERRRDELLQRFRSGIAD
jgi:hypothetical protein